MGRVLECFCFIIICNLRILVRRRGRWEDNIKTDINKAGNVRINVTLRRVRATIVAVEKQ